MLIQSSNILSNPLTSLLVREADGQYRAAHDDEVLRCALRVISRRVRRGTEMTSPRLVKDYLTLKLAGLEHEVFCVLFLDAHNRMIEMREMFRGTVSQTSVYPREIVREALQLNASSVILAHNHPSGHPEPSRADEFLTETLKKALALVDVRALDHLIVCGGEVTSFAERGLM